MGRGQLGNVDSTVKRTFVTANRAIYSHITRAIVEGGLKEHGAMALLLRLLESGRKNSKIACSRHASHFCVAPGGIRFDLRDPRGTQRSKSSYTTWICLYLPEYALFWVAIARNMALAWLDLRARPCTTLTYYTPRHFLYPLWLDFWTNEIITMQLRLISWHNASPLFESCDPYHRVYKSCDQWTKLLSSQE